MIRTPYYDLAEKIGNGRIDEIEYFVCINLPLENQDNFEWWYRENALNSKLFKTGRFAWMSTDDDALENNNHRIIALLLLHEMEVNP